MLCLEPVAKRAWWRRGLLLSLLLASTVGATLLMAVVLGTNSLTVAEAAVLGVFAISFGWIALSFWAAVAGFVLSLLGCHPLTLQRENAAAGPLPPLRTRCAVLMPIYNEDTRRVLPDSRRRSDPSRRPAAAATSISSC
jgi:membrane glycosyltransferase